MATKVYVEIPLSGKELTPEEAREFASFLESAIDAYGREPGKYAGRTVENVTVYPSAEDVP